jgi:transposase
MKFNDLTQEDKEYFKKIYLDKSIKWDERIAILKEYADVSRRTIQKWVSKLGLKETAEVESPELIKAKERKFNKSKKRFIITWAQNNTPVHQRFLFNLESYAKHISADIHVIAGRYKNPTSVFSDAKHDVWHQSVTKYLDAARHDVHKYASIMSDVKIQPTAVNPMTGLQGMSGINSCVFGSPKVQMMMIPVLEGCKPKMMVTTGACTVKNYTDSKAGKKGEFHHTLGFVIVEIKDDEIFFIRQVTADSNGDFIDLFNSVKFVGESKELTFDSTIDQVNWSAANFGAEPVEWTGESSVSRTERFEACVLGDLHYGHEDSEVLTKTLELLSKFNPKHIVLHDVFDGYSISHHEMKDPFAQYRKEVKGTNSLKTEVNYMLDQLEEFTKFEDCDVVIVRSNHDDFIDRWLKNGDWKKQPTPKNSMEYMEYSQILLRQYAESDKVKGVIPELINTRYPEFITLGRSDSYMVKGWELAQHGDVGSSGSRGSLQQFRKLNTKIIVGHYHAPGRMDGALSVGTTTKLRVGYNIGASSWLQSHVIIHENGKAQHINFIEGDFTTLKY